MEIKKAIKETLKGSSIRRKKWHKNEYVYFYQEHRTSTYTILGTEDSFTVPKTSPDKSGLRLRQSNRRWKNWKPNHNDILATDWEFTYKAN